MANEIYNNAAAKAGKLFLPKVADAIFEVDGIVAFIAKANTSAQVEITTTQDEIRGGQANSIIGVVTSQRDVNITFATPEWQPEFLAANVGTTIKVGNVNCYIDDVPYTADANGKITLAAQPVDNVIRVQLAGGWVTVTVTEKTADLSPYGVTEGECITAIALMEKNGKEISILADTDPTIGKLILTSPIFRGDKGKVGSAQYTFPSFALSGNWTQSFSSDASYEISGKAIAVAGDNCGEGSSYGYYREYIIDEDTLSAFAQIIVSPSVIELKTGDTEQLAVYGAKGALYEKTDITSGSTFAVDEGSASILSVTSAGVVSALGEGTGKVTATHTATGLKGTVTITVTA